MKGHTAVSGVPFLFSGKNNPAFSRKVVGS
jgi:hypothetical protein